MIAGVGMSGGSGCGGDGGIGDEVDEDGQVSRPYGGDALLKVIIPARRLELQPQLSGPRLAEADQSK